MKNSKVTILCTLLISSLFLQGCNDTDRSIAAGAIIGAAIGAAVVSDPGPVCHGGYVTRCHEYRDYRGFYHRECRETYDSCSRVYALEMELPVGEMATPPVSDKMMNMADSFGMSVDSMKKVNKGISSLKAGDPSSFQGLGIDSSEISNLAGSGRLSPGSLEKLSRSLDMNPADTEAFVSRIANEAQAQVADSKSPYWKSCTSSGKWKTPENSYCASASWTGCSPETGASLCY